MSRPGSRLILGDMRLAVLALLIAALPAKAQAPRPAPSPQPVDVGARAPISLTGRAPAEGGSVVVEELEVIAHAPGPAMWTVSRGDSQVVILGAYSPLPHRLEWNTSRLDRALTAADGFYETKAAINPLELVTLLFDQGSFKNANGRKLDEVIGPERQAKLKAIAAIAHADTARMQPFKPAFAGLFAYQTFLRAAGLSGEKPGTTVRKLVDDHRVPKRTLARLGGMSLIRSLQRMDEPAQLACLDAALDQTNWESGHAIAAADAWAAGRVSQLRKLESTAILDHCLDSGGAKAVLEKGVSDAVESIEEILAKPGRNVAMVDINVLTTRNGVLDRLKAKGAQIGVPRE